MPNPAQKAAQQASQRVVKAVLGSQAIDEANQIVARPIEGITKAAVKILQPGDLLDTVVIPLLGDPSRGGEIIERIGKVPVEVRTHAGPDYPRIMDPYNVAWASAAERIKALSDAVRAAKAMSPSGRVIGMYANQGPTSLLHSVDTLETALQMLQHQRPHRADINAFNDMARKALQREDFPGILHPDVRKYLYPSGMGGARTTVLDKMGQQRWTKLGFPDISLVQRAVTEPDLIDVPSYQAGYSVVELEPTGAAIQGVGLPHSTYPRQLGGNYLGRFEKTVPVQEMFRKSYGEPQNLIGRQAPLYGGPVRSLAWGLPKELFDRATVDALEQSMKRRR